MSRITITSGCVAICLVTQAFAGVDLLPPRTMRKACCVPSDCSTAGYYPTAWRVWPDAPQGAAVLTGAVAPEPDPAFSPPPPLAMPQSSIPGKPAASTPASPAAQRPFNASTGARAVPVNSGIEQYPPVIPEAIATPYPPVTPIPLASSRPSGASVPVAGPYPPAILEPLR